MYCARAYLSYDKMHSSIVVSKRIPFLRLEKVQKIMLPNTRDFECVFTQDLFIPNSLIHFCRFIQILFLLVTSDFKKTENRVHPNQTIICLF